MKSWRRRPTRRPATRGALSSDRSRAPSGLARQAAARSAREPGVLDVVDVVPGSPQQNASHQPSRMGVAPSGRRGGRGRPNAGSLLAARVPPGIELEDLKVASGVVRTGLLILRDASAASRGSRQRTRSGRSLPTAGSAARRRGPRPRASRTEPDARPFLWYRGAGVCPSGMWQRGVAGVDGRTPAPSSPWVGELDASISRRPS